MRAPPHSFAFGFVLVATLIAACASSSPPPVVVAPVAAPVGASATPTPSVSASGKPPAVARPLLGDLPNARSWLEPQVIDRLAKDCRWQPNDLDGGDSDERKPMSCRLEIQQSCAPDPCHDEVEDECKPACTKTCQSCASTCTAGCESCKSRCTDDACRRDCAQQCGKCRDGCIQTVDRCSTGECGARYATCDKESNAELKRPACRAACGNVGKCTGKCSELSQNDPCVMACKKKFAASCMEKLFWSCVVLGTQR